ncbi:MAG: Do family serine endopeptidase [Bacteroidetes bacterium]|nr:Do family serine endopeptidase [Bacteroidota bacterium]
MKRSVLAAVFFIAVGIIFGVALVTDFDGIPLGKAQTKEVKLGADRKPSNANVDLKAANDAFVAVGKEATPSVVYIVVTTKAKKNPHGDDFFRFFPDFKFKMPDEQQSQGSGSGVIVSKDGYILTNNHVVENADEHGIDVVLTDTRRFKAKLIGTDPLTDVAVIKIDADNLPVAMLGNSDDVQVGQWALAIGNPLGLNSTVTLGIISYIGRSIRIINDSYGVENFIQTDAAINPGNSGGALVNINGEVIGINTAIATTNARYQGYGFAIPINLAKSVATDLIKFGKVERGYIGVQISVVDETLAKANGLDKAEGVFVQDVVGDAAKEAGLKAGDIILSIDDHAVNQPNELQAYVATKHPGDKIKAVIWRDGKKIEKMITLKPRQDSNKLASNDENNGDDNSETSAGSKSITFDKLGFSVAKVSTKVMKDRDVKNGVIVSDLKQFGEASNRGLQVDDIILEVDRKPVSSTTDLQKIVKTKKPGDALLMRVKDASGTTRFVAVMIPKD